MALLKRRFGAHLSNAARDALADCRPYPSLAAFRNPLTRPIARRIAESDWAATLNQIDFPYSMTDCVVGGVPCVSLRPEKINDPTALIIYLHAGALVCGSARANAAAVLPSCHLLGVEALAIDYSLAPEHRYPTQMVEIELVYRGALDNGCDPDKIMIVGDSSGGSLALASLYRWRRLGLKSPAGAMLQSPILDAEAASDTYESVKGRDPLFVATGRDSGVELFRLYAGGADVSDPEISPMAGDPSGLPPILLHVGTREILLGDSARFAEKARQAGVDVTLRVFDGMFHLFHQHWRLAEAKAAHDDIADFYRRVTP